MAKSFSSTKGQAKSAGETYKYLDGEQTLRFAGDILPRYLYWINKTPFDCLQFDREEEKWNNAIPNPVKEYSDELKSSWSYMARAFTPDGKLVVVALKKKMFEEMQKLAEEEGDPFDPDTGYAIIFEKKKTGSQAFNVAYSLNVARILKAGKSPLTAEQRALLEAAEPLDKLFPVPTVAEQREALRKLSEADSAKLPANVASEFDSGEND